MIGAGMAGTRFLDELIALNHCYDITVFNREPQAGYNRIMLSPVLAGESRLKDIVTHDEEWFVQNDITLYTDKSIVEIEREKKRVIDLDGKHYDFDKLIIATGSKPFVLPIDNTRLDGVVSFRDIQDVEKMQQIAKQNKRAIVIGGGLLGLEAAHGLRMQGMSVSVIHRSEILMNAQMDAETGALLQAELATEKEGIKALDFYMGSEVTEIIADESGVNIKFVRLSDGNVLPCDLLVMAIGIRPNIELGTQADLEVNRGIVVNDQMLTSDSNIYALGECVEHRGKTYGLVAPLYEQAEVLAKVLTIKSSDSEVPIYSGSLTSTKLKVTGINLFSAGDFNAQGEKAEIIVFRDDSAGIYRKLVIENDRIVGILLFNDTYESSWLFEQLVNKTDISQIRETVIFGQGFEIAA